MTTEDVRNELNRIDVRIHQKLVHYVQTASCPEDVAEECIQYAYLQALTQADKIRRSDRILSWIITVAKRKAGKEMKQRKRLMCVKPEMIVYEDAIENRTLTRIDLERVLKERVNIWPIYYEKILWMYYREERSFAEIAQLLSMPQGTVRNAHYRIKKDITRYLNA